MNLASNTPLISGNLSLDQQPHKALLTQPRFYFSVKFILFLLIILERVFLYLNGSHSKAIVYFLLQVVLLPCSIILEYIILKIMDRKRIKIDTQQLILFLFQIATLEILVECTLRMFHNNNTEYIKIIQHDLLFLAALNAIFVHPVPYRTGILLYINIICNFHLLGSQQDKYCIFWAIMAAVVLITLVVYSRVAHKAPLKEAMSKNLRRELENHTKALVILNKNWNILFMNGNFRGLLNSKSSSDALGEALKLRKLESYPERVRKEFIEELRIEKGGKSQLLRQRTKNLGGAKARISTSNAIGSFQALGKSRDGEKHSMVTFKDSIDVLQPHNHREIHDRSSFVSNHGKGSQPFIIRPAKLC